MRALTFTTLLALTLALTGSAGAGHCTTWTTSEPEVEAFGFYLDNDLCQPGCIFSIWTYEESNGIPGLQRGDEVKDDTCHGMIEADTLSPY